jgi:arylsulfatase A-like enzyme
LRVRILYVDCDTLRPDHLGCYGYTRPTSPTVDSLAGESVVFDRVHASDVPCLPSRTALFSGQLGIRTGVVGHAGRYARGSYPGDGHVTDPARYPLAMALSRAGYLTATFTTFHQRHLAWRFCAGWDEIHRFASTIGDEVATELEGPAIDWLTRNGHRDNWFLHLHFWDPHVPYNTPLEYGNPMADYPAPEFPTAEEISEQQRSYGPMGAADLINDYHLPHPRMPRALRNRDDYRTLIDGYDVGIRYFDDTLGRIVDTLGALGILDETVIILSSDHGENQGELNLYTSHSAADAITTRIPLVVRWPGVTSGTRSDALVYGLDLGPTLLDLLGVEVPQGWDGISFAPAVRGEPSVGREQLVFGQGAWFAQRAVMRDNWLYLRTLHAALDPMPDELLFDLRADPHERNNLAAREPARLEGMRDRLETWWDKYGGREADPLVTMAGEGGAYYPRLFKDGYLKVLRDSGRDWAAKEIEARYIAPVPDRFDLDLR